jgi:hypothetical protein
MFKGLFNRKQTARPQADERPMLDLLPRPALMRPPVTGYTLRYLITPDEHSDKVTHIEFAGYSERG